MTNVGKVGHMPGWMRPDHPGNAKNAPGHNKHKHKHGCGKGECNENIAQTNLQEPGINSQGTAGQINPNSVQLPDTIFQLAGNGTNQQRVQPLIPPNMVQSESPVATFDNAAQFPPTTFPAGVPISIPSEADVAGRIDQIFKGF